VRERLGALFKRNYGDVYRFVCRMTQSREWAEDIARKRFSGWRRTARQLWQAKPRAAGFLWSRGTFALPGFASSRGAPKWR